MLIQHLFLCFNTVLIAFKSKYIELLLVLIFAVIEMLRLLQTLELLFFSSPPETCEDVLVYPYCVTLHW